MDEETFRAQLDANWFSFSNASKLYNQFLSLDLDKNGMLSHDELLPYNGSKKFPVQFTKTAVSRIFEENITYSPMEMDYKTFLDLVLAIENRDSIQSLKVTIFFFLDVYSSFVLIYFYYS